ncbi:STAS domain-containing protein [Denitrificimonas sp. JX-1]|uniref:STAS domain-containing protein n=1 Tax=Denitrificimonas halotolerans TaxID=3098930 RepID=A0ABU5GPX0_9GAMM|nr:STAS domain-containing protein [Denitrificimonas sp. JX-1]MDY7218909.1 STAS domain-containing protein [Denitrificimonas sp. JX-1]
MSDGQIQYAEYNDTFVLKCSGDVRLTFCSALNETITKIIKANLLKSIVIDLTEVISIDSTTLGLLAKLSILSKRKFGMLPTLASINPDVNRVLDSMGFNQVFNLVHTPAPCPECLNDLPKQDQSEDVVKERVLEAHQILMSLNDSNRNEFRDLVSALQNQSAQA